MYESVEQNINSDRINKFKLALYNLDCLQIAGVDYKYITDCGFVKSPSLNILDYGSFGYIQCWELRPVKPTLYNLVNLSTRIGIPRKRRTKLIDLYTIDYNENKHIILKSKRPRDDWEYRLNWSEILKGYLEARQSHRDSLSRAVIRPPSAYYPETIDVINILLVASIYSPNYTRLVLRKRRRLDLISNYI